MDRHRARREEEEKSEERRKKGELILHNDEAQMSRLD